MAAGDYTPVGPLLTSVEDVVEEVVATPGVEKATYKLTLDGGANAGEALQHHAHMSKKVRYLFTLTVMACVVVWWACAGSRPALKSADDLDHVVGLADAVICNDLQVTVNAMPTPEQHQILAGDYKQIPGVTSQNFPVWAKMPVDGKYPMTIGPANPVGPPMEQHAYLILTARNSLGRRNAEQDRTGTVPRGSTLVWCLLYGAQGAYKHDVGTLCTFASSAIEDAGQAPPQCIDASKWSAPDLVGLPELNVHCSNKADSRTCPRRLSFAPSQKYQVRGSNIGVQVSGNVMDGGNAAGFVPNRNLGVILVGSTVGNEVSHSITGNGNGKGNTDDT